MPRGHWHSCRFCPHVARHLVSNRIGLFSDETLSAGGYCLAHRRTSTDCPWSYGVHHVCRVKPRLSPVSLARSRCQGWRRRSGRRRMLVERLKARALPAVFVVTSVVDEAPGLLRQVLIDANDTAGLDSICLECGFPLCTTNQCSAHAAQRFLEARDRQKAPPKERGPATEKSGGLGKDERLWPLEGPRPDTSAGAAFVLWKPLSHGRRGRSSRQCLSCGAREAWHGRGLPSEVRDRPKARSPLQQADRGNGPIMRLPKLPTFLLPARW